LQVRLTVGLVEHAQGRERRQWAQDLRQSIAALQAAAR
jgi:hypothetical protein